jgi:hypothetical protein
VGTSVRLFQLFANNMYLYNVIYMYTVLISWDRAEGTEDLIIRGPRSSSFWIPQNIFHHMDKQAHTGDTVLVMNREMTGRTQTLLWWLEREGVKATENIGPVGGGYRKRPTLLQSS